MIYMKPCPRDFDEFHYNIRTGKSMDKRTLLTYIRYSKNYLAYLKRRKLRSEEFDKTVPAFEEMLKDGTLPY